MSLPAVLRLPNFRLLAATRLCAVLALQAQAVIVGWQLFTLTRDPFMLGLIGLTEAVPALCAALFAGHFVDTRNPYLIYVGALLLLFLNTLALLFTAGGIWDVAHHILIPFIFAGVFMSGLARSCVMPASFKLLSRTVARHEIPQASATLSSAFQIGAVTGPAVAGLVYGAFGVTAAWMMPVTLMTLSCIAALRINVPHSAPEGQAREKIIASIKAGWTFILGNRVLLSVMALDMFAVLFGGAVAMLPAFADMILHTGSEGLGILRAAPAIGSGAMALFLALRPMHEITGRRLLLCVAGFGVCMLGFGFSSVFWLSCVFLALSGAFDSVSMVIRGTLMQWLTPDAMRGRVSSVNSMFIISSNEIGAFESGLTARLMGLAPSVVFGGAMSIMISGLMGWFQPELRRLRVQADAPSD